MMPSQKIPASPGLKLRRACGHLSSYVQWRENTSRARKVLYLESSKKKVGELGGHGLPIP